jgi:hypothetical protein
MDDASVSQALDCDVAVNVKRWPLVLVAALFLAGIAPVFLARSTAPSRPAPPQAAVSATGCTSTPAAPAGSATPTESPSPQVNTKGSC